MKLVRKYPCVHPWDAWAEKIGSDSTRSHCKFAINRHACANQLPPLIPTLDMICKVDTNNWIIHYLPSIRELVTVAFAYALRFCLTVVWVQPGCRPRIVST